MSPVELAGEVIDRDELLGSGLEVAELDLAVAELVAEDDREVGPVPGGRLELLAELALAELGPGGDPGGPEDCRDPQAIGGGGGVRADDDGDRRRLGDRRGPLGVEGQEDATEADPEADPGRRPATEKLDEPVVSAAAMSPNGRSSPSPSLHAAPAIAPTAAKAMSIRFMSPPV